MLSCFCWPVLIVNDGIVESEDTKIGDKSTEEEEEAGSNEGILSADNRL